MTTNIELKDIDKIKLFSNISETTKNKMKNIAIKKILKKGNILFSAEDNLEYIYGILAGKTAIYRINTEGQKRVFFILGEGELINEVIFDNLPVSADCEAFEDTIVIRFNKSEFLKLMQEDFNLTMQILNSMGKKQRRLYRQLKNTLPIGMEKKLAAKLWKLAKDYGENSKNKEYEWKKINMNISTTYIACMLGTSRETISRAMKQLQKVGACRWEGRTLYVKEDILLKYYRTKESK